MLNRIDYRYAGGDLLGKPNTYFFSPYHGKAFLFAWLHAREKCLDVCKGADFKGEGRRDSILHGTANFLRKMYSKLQSNVFRREDEIELDLLLRNFEAKKRIFEDYCPGFKSAGRTDYGELTLYVDFAELLVAAYAINGRLQYINALLKCLDILCAHLTELSGVDKGRVGQLIINERNYVNGIAESLGLKLETV